MAPSRSPSSGLAERGATAIATAMLWSKQPREANGAAIYGPMQKPIDIIAGATSTEFHEPESRRFNRDFAAEDAARREQERQRRENVNNYRREQMISRDQQRWDQMGREE